MSAAPSLQQRIASALRRDTLRCALGHGARAALRAAPLAALIAALCSFAGLAALASFGVGCAAVLLVFVALALRAAQRADQAQLLCQLDARCTGHGVLSTVDSVAESAYFAPLVLAQAAAALQRDPGALRWRVQRAQAMRFGMWLLLAFALSWWPQGAAAMQANALAPSAATAAQGTVVSDSVATAAAAQRPAGSITLGLERRVLVPGDDAPLHIEWIQTAAAAAAADVRFVALFSDGFDGADHGYGRDQRPVRLEASARLQSDGPFVAVHSTASLRQLLQVVHIEGPGLVSMEVRALAHLQDGSEFEVRSAALTFTLAEAGSAAPLEMPVRVAVEPQASPSSSGMEQPKKGVGGGAGPVKSGEAEELGKATLVPKAVKPLVNDSGMVDKEVDVFQREAGEAAKVPPPLRGAEPKTDLQQVPLPERGGLRATWNASELRLIQRYFRRLQGGAGGR